MAETRPATTIREIVAEAAAITREEDAEALQYLDQLAELALEMARDMDLDVDNPTVLESMIGGLHLANLRATAYFTRGLITDTEHDSILHVNGEAIQALAIVAGSKRVSAADLEEIVLLEPLSVNP